MSGKLIWISPFFSLFLLTLAIESSFPIRVGCGNEPTEESVRVAEQSFQENIVSLNDSGAATRSLEIDVYFHIVAANATAEGGWVSNAQIDAQIAVLNQDYAEVGITWRHMSTTRIISQDWFEGITQDSIDANLLKKVFRQGEMNTLNVFTVGFPNSTLLGYSTFPWDYRSAPDLDGIIIRHSSFPGGSLIQYSLGKTLVHEAGHWVGLYHTFQGGCTGQGDSVDDTPAVSVANFGCPTQRDSCPGGGVDLINNFMDYTDDDCKSAFTPGQISRMQTMSKLYRSAI